MNDKFFIDTNVFVYSFDGSAYEKQARARSLIAQACADRSGKISFQVVQEFINVATKKFKKPLLKNDLGMYLETIMFPLCEVFPSIDFYKSALDIRERTGYSFYDSMILRAALQSGCSTLYSEDMQDGFKLWEVTVKNPFTD